MIRYRLLTGVLGALPVFESAARHKSFTKAGEEMRLTQPAVSRRISSLERRLGFSVFKRQHNKLELTPEGRQLMSAVEFSLDHLNEAVIQLTEQITRRKLTIACGFSFSSMWLQPRFSRFRKMLDGVEVHLIASEFPDDLDPQMIDIRVLWEDNFWQGREVRPLFRDIVYPVCSRAFAKKFKLPKSGEVPPGDFQILTLLFNQSSGSDRLDWEEWFRTLRIDFKPDNPRYVYDNYQFTIQAAIDGEGIALGYSGLIDDLIEREELIKVGQSIRLQSGRTFIEFEPNRLSEARRDLIYDWFQSESGLGR